MGARGRGVLPRGLAAFVLLSLLFVPAPASAGSPPIAPHVMTLAAHAPVLIEGDAALGASDAVVSGSGTPQDPYVMEGWSINASTNPGIAIRNTTKSLLIRNLTLYRAAPIPLADGIDLFQVRNVEMANITALATLAAVRVRSSYNISVNGSSALGDGAGLWVDGSTQVTVAGNEIRANGYVMEVGVYVDGSDRVVIERNRMALDTSGFGHYEIQAHNTTNLAVLENEIGTDSWVPHDGTGVWLVDVVNLTFRGNILHSRSLSLSPFAGAGRSSGWTFYRSPAIFDTYVITPDNTINGVPVLFRNRCQDLDLDRVVAGEIIVSNCPGVRISNTTFQSGQVGVLVVNSVGAVITFNRFVDMDLGVILFEGGAMVYHNDFVHSGTAASMSVRAPVYSLDYPVGGNYWGDGPAVDQCSGISQDVCRDPDGFVDKPNDLFGTGTWTDRFPLARPINRTNTWPTADLRMGGTRWDVNTPVVFNASGVSDREDPRTNLQVRWDFDGDWRWDTNWSTNLTVAHRFASPGVYMVRMMVRDSGGLLATASVLVVIPEPSDWRAWALLLGVPSVIFGTMIVAFFAKRYRRTRPPSPDSMRFPPPKNP